MRRIAALCAGTLALGVAGCGDDEDFPNDPRPPALITLTASIGPDAVSVSPAQIGAGPVTLLIVNETDSSQSVTFASEGGQTRTGPILPDDTATLRADVKKGLATLRVTGNGIKAARLKVGPERSSSQNDLLQP